MESAAPRPCFRQQGRTARRAVYALTDGLGRVNCRAFEIGKGGAEIGSGAPTNTARRCTGGGLFPSIFAARHDMRGWPMLGALAASGATIFINRDNKRAGYRGVAQVAAALRAGATVVAFPEGTSTDGSGLLPFRTGVFQAAVDAGAAVVPAAIRYRTIDGEPVTDANRDVVGWFRGENFVGHILRLGSHRRTEAEVTFAAPLAPPHGDRRTLAAAAEASVRALLGIAAAERPAAFGRVLDTTTGVT